MDAFQPSLLSDSVRQLEDLLVEARELRDRVSAAMNREREPFYPERRLHYEIHEPERRRR